MRISQDRVSSSARIGDRAHNKRNRSEYDGVFDVDIALVEAMLRVARDVEAAVRALGALK